MKKFFLVAFLFATTAVMAQISNPYVNGGVSIQNNTVSYNGELGINSVSNRFAATVQSATLSPDNVWSLGGKYYRSISVKAQTINPYVFVGASFALTKDHPITFEPGLAATWNINKRFAPQATLSFPIQQNSVLRSRPLGIAAGLSVNYTL